MRVIICGSRATEFLLPCSTEATWLDQLNAQYQFSEVITGGQYGIDTCAKEWAFTRGIDVVVFYANWRKYARSAGPLRNKTMLAYLIRSPRVEPVMVIAFPGGKGTASMCELARGAGVDVLHYQAQQSPLEVP